MPWQSIMSMSRPLLATLINAGGGGGAKLESRCAHYFVLHNIFIDLSCMCGNKNMFNYLGASFIHWIHHTTVQILGVASYRNWYLDFGSEWFHLWLGITIHRGEAEGCGEIPSKRRNGFDIQLFTSTVPDQCHTRVHSYTYVTNVTSLQCLCY